MLSQIYSIKTNLLKKLLLNIDRNLDNKINFFRWKPEYDGNGTFL